MGSSLKSMHLAFAGTGVLLAGLIAMSGDLHGSVGGKPAGKAGLTAGLKPLAESIVQEVEEAVRAVRCPPIMAGMGPSQRWPHACGTGRPPYPYQRRLDGMWTITARGNPKVAALTIAVSRESHGLGYRDPEGPLLAAGVLRYPGSSNYRNFDLSISRSDDGTIRIRFGQFEYCNCVPVEYTARPTSNPDVMAGEWIYKDQRGPAVWRRGPSARIQSVEMGMAIRTDQGTYVSDRFGFGERPGRVERTHRVTCGYGQMRGNCDGFWIAIRGENFAGAQDLWIDPASHMEINKAGWLCANGRMKDWGAGWRGCGSTKRPGDGVVGLSVKLLFWDGIAPGKRTLWVNGQPIPFEMVIHNYPADDKIGRPALVDLRAMSPDGNPLAALAEGSPFVLEAHYDGPNPAEWVSAAVPGALLPRPAETAASGTGRGRRIILLRTEDAKIFRSVPLIVTPPPDTIR